jgi:spore germination cell wall hydrolase CwlJ-like protein
MGGCALFPGNQALLSDRECMTRAMYFESNRSSEDGMLAVGTTVMNRLAAPGYPKTVCSVVGQPGQHANGVLTQPMSARERARVERVADAVLSGERHAKVGGAMFFHTAGLTFPYRNMHYVAVAGGNAFYEKRAPDRALPAASPIPTTPFAASVIAHTGHTPRTIGDLLAMSFAEPGPVSRDVSSARVPFPPLQGD